MTSAPAVAESTPPAPSGARARGRALPVGALSLAVAVVASAVGLVIAGGAYSPAPVGLPDAGPLVGWLLPVLRVLTDAAAILVIGFLLSAVVLCPQGPEGLVTRPGRRDLVTAAWAAVAWSTLALMQALVEVASVLGLPLQQALTPGVLSTYAFDIPLTRALLITAAAALALACAAAVTASVGVTAIWLMVAVIIGCLPQLAGHGAALGDHALALSGGIAHVASASLWVGGVIALAWHALRRDVPLAIGVRRFGAIALICILLLAVSGVANAYTRLDSVSELITTGYGQVTLIKVVVLLMLAGLATHLRRRIQPTIDVSGRVRAFVRIIGIEVVLMSAAIGTGVALSLSPFPRVEELLPTPAENILGFPFPPPPTVQTVVLGFHLEPVFLLASLVAAGLYCTGFTRLISRGDRWSVLRLVSWLSGIGLVIWATNAGIAAYGQVSVGMHMIQHMVLSMVAPMLLVLGAPFTLALRALRPSPGPYRGPREWIVWLLNSPYAKVITNPLVVFVLYAVGLYALYFTPAFAWLMGNHIGHLWMLFHVLAVGYLFAWIIMGADPLPYALPHWARFGLLLVAIAIHAFFAVVIMGGSTPIGEEWYAQVRPPWITDPAEDSRVSGQIAWGVSEVPMLFMLVTVAVQWARADDREARRKDRQAERDGDAELSAYNDYLQRLNERSSR